MGLAVINRPRMMESEFNEEYADVVVDISKVRNRMEDIYDYNIESRMEPTIEIVYPEDAPENFLPKKFTDPDFRRKNLTHTECMTVTNAIYENPVQALNAAMRHSRAANPVELAKAIPNYFTNQVKKNYLLKEVADSVTAKEAKNFLDSFIEELKAVRDYKKDPNTIDLRYSKPWINN